MQQKKISLNRYTIYPGCFEREKSSNEIKVKDSNIFAVDLYNSKNLSLEVNDNGVFGYNENLYGFYITKEQLKGIDYSTKEFENLMEKFENLLIRLTNPTKDEIDYI